MKALSAYIIAAAFLVIVFLPKQEIRNPFDTKLLEISDIAATKINAKLTSNTNQNGSITSSFSGYELSEKQVNTQVTNETKGFTQKAAKLLAWPAPTGELITLSAPGMDWKHHFASSFLVGVRPFPVENKSLPLYVISKRKTYMDDKTQHNALEMWQNSAQSYVLPEGDCEDHAILLADWLISEGVDARVVGGEYKSGGHAWVIAIINGNSFLLEATDKRAGKSWNHYPLAELAKYYSPKYMFNRTDFWENTNSANTSDYTNSSWVKRSTYKKTR
jgi:hypothetical protein